MNNKLKELRESQGLQQKEFGESLGVKQTTYSNYELGVTEPKSDFWIAVSDQYRVSIDYLFGQTENQHGTKWSGKSQLDERYSALDQHGKRLVDAVMDIELGRVEQPAFQQPPVALGVDVFVDQDVHLAVCVGRH